MQLEGGEDISAADTLGSFKAGSGKWGSCLRIVNPLLVRPIKHVDLKSGRRGRRPTERQGNRDRDRATGGARK